MIQIRGCLGGYRKRWRWW